MSEASTQSIIDEVSDLFRCLVVNDADDSELAVKLWTKGCWNNLLFFLCKHTASEDGAEKAPYCDTVAAAGAGAERLTCSTVATCRSRRMVSPAVLSSHCCSMTAVLGLDG